jgi:hypothetical protein
MTQRRIVTIANQLVTSFFVASLLCQHVLTAEAQQDDAIDPRAAAVMDKYVEATGGQEAYAKVTSRIVQGQLEMPGRGISGTMVTAMRRPQNFYSEINTAAGRHRRGSNGKTVWVMEPGQDPRILTGLEKVLAIRDGTIDRFAHWRELAARLEYAGEEEVDGKRCAKIVLTYRMIDPDVKESPVTIYVDRATHLITQYTTEVMRPNMLANVTAVLDDYREADGIRLAHKMALKTNNVEYTVTLKRVGSNVPLAPEQFVLPREIQELLVK